MPDEVKPDPKQAPTQDAQLAAENVATNEEKAPTVDLEGDYEAAQQFSVSEVDRTGKGNQSAEAATAPHFRVPEPKETKTEAQPTSKPDDYREMASDVASPSEAPTTEVSDDLIEQAEEMGQPG